MRSIGFKAVRRWYIRAGCIEAGRVPHTDYVYFEAISKSNTLMNFDRNWKRLSGSYKTLYDIKCIILTLKMYEKLRLTCIALKKSHNKYIHINFQIQNAPIWPLTSLSPWTELSDGASTLMQFVISLRTFLVWMPSINKKRHQKLLVNFIEIMAGRL